MPGAVFIPSQLNDLSVDVSLGTPAQGALFYRGASVWNALAAGTSGQALRTNGVGANPSWSSSLGAMTFTGNVTLSAVNLVTDTSTGTQIGTGSAQKLGFFGATPVVQISGSTDILAGWVTLGLRGASSNPPLNMGSGALTCGAITGTSLTVPGAGANSEKFGASATAAGTSAVGIGNSVSAIGSNSVAVGYSALSQFSSTALGYSASAGQSSSMALGNQASTTAVNQCVIGGSVVPYTDMYMGGGVTSSSPPTTRLNACGGSGTDIAGASFTLAGGRGTGAALGGDIIFQSTAAGASATALRTLIEKMRLASTGLLTYSQETSVQTRSVLDLATSFPTATDASRKGRAVWQIYDTAAREALRMEASGAAAMLGFLGAAAVARPGAYTLTGSATRTLPADPSSAYTGAADGEAKLADLNTLRTTVSSLLGVVRQILTDLGNSSGYGLLNA